MAPPATPSRLGLSCKSWGSFGYVDEAAEDVGCASTEQVVESVQCVAGCFKINSPPGTEPTLQVEREALCARNTKRLKANTNELLA